MTTRLLPLILLLAICAVTKSQSKRETVKTGTVENQIGGIESGMYGGSKSKVATEHFNKATELLDRNELHAAEKEFRKALEADPGYIEAYDNLGTTYRKLAQYDKAIETYKKSISLYPEGLTARVNLAVVHSIKNDYDSAIGEYKEIIRFAPGDAEAYFGLANAYMVQKKYDEALNNAYKALEIYQKNNSHLVNDGHYMLGMIYFYMKDNPNAAKYIKKAKDGGVEIHPELLKKLDIK